MIFVLTQDQIIDGVVDVTTALKKDFFPDSEFADWLGERGIAMINTGDYGSVTFAVSEDNKIDWQPISQKGLHRQSMN